MHATVVGAAATSPATGGPARASIANVWYSMMINLQKKRKKIRNSWAIWTRKDELKFRFSEKVKKI